MRALLCVVVGLAPLVARADNEAAALERARELFPEFSNSVHTDEARARKAFDALVSLGPAVRQRLLEWLEEQFQAKLGEYVGVSRAGGSGLRQPSPADARRIEELRQQLVGIRGLRDEAQMKKALQQDGWPALRELLRLNRSSIRSLDTEDLAAPDSDKLEAVLSQLRQVGGFRRELRLKLGQAAPEVEEEIRAAREQAGEGREMASLRTSRRAASVLAENEALKDGIAAREYAGILETNHWRIAAGMEPLLIDPKLCEAARDHSKDMAEMGFFAHESPVKGKKMPWDRAMHFKTSARAENIAINDSTEAANQAWFLSPGHHKNLFNPEFRVIGLGITGRHYTQMFR